MRLKAGGISEVCARVVRCCLGMKVKIRANPKRPEALFLVPGLAAWKRNKTPLPLLPPQRHCQHQSVEQCLCASCKHVHRFVSACECV
jgi:hypothetical protein